MRFVIAALAAFSVLMLDVDFSSGPISSLAANSEPLAALPDSESDAAPFAARFIAEPADASAQDATVQNATVEDATIEGVWPALAGQPNDIPVSAPVTAIDAFCHTLKAAAEANEIPVAFFARLIWQESRFRRNEVSHAGAQGVAQFMPETAAEVGLDDPFDPHKALPASARLLRRLRNDFGNLGLAAAAYNAGSGRIQKWLARQNELPRETRDYVRIITGTNAEDWIEGADRLAIRIDLPREAPCEGVGGLSKAKDVALVSASPALGVSMIIRKAETARLAARAATGHGRKRLALLLGKRTAAAARPGSMRQVVIVNTRAKSAKDRVIRLATRARSAS